MSDDFRCTNRLFCFLTSYSGTRHWILRWVLTDLRALGWWFSVNDFRTLIEVSRCFWEFQVDVFTEYTRCNGFAECSRRTAKVKAPLAHWQLGLVFQKMAADKLDSRSYGQQAHWTLEPTAWSRHMSRDKAVELADGRFRMTVEDLLVNGVSDIRYAQDGSYGKIRAIQQGWSRRACHKGY